MLTLLLALSCRTKDLLPDTGGVDDVPVDADLDGFDEETDCDDTDPAVNPDAEEICDGLDNDCDGDVDGGATDAGSWYVDGDDDGYGSGEPTVGCEQPSGTAAQDGDCDDSDVAWHPGAPEEDCADPNDYNCDGSVGYADADGDGYAACTECDDEDPDIHPDADEVCDGEDNDCDGSIDGPESLDASTWYVDGDGDGYGDPAQPGQACEQPVGSVADASDCQDGDATVHPGADELCDGLDNDCDGVIPDDEVDDDGDLAVDCEQDAGGWDGDASVTAGGDCDDDDATVYAGADELCDGLDNDCDGLVPDDEVDDDGDFTVECSWDAGGWDGDGAVVGDADCDDTDATTYVGAAYNESSSDCMTDGDGDGYGAEVPASGVSAGTDCDDADNGSNPGASEACDGLDNDCDSDVDEGLLGSGSACPAQSCQAVYDDGHTTSGSYSLEGQTGAVFTAWCDQDVDGGGWTLVGSVVNDILTTGSHVRSWDSYTVWTDSTTFGSISGRQSADYKGDAFSEIAGDDVLVVTDEYSFAFYSVVGAQDFASHISAEYTASCNTTFLASGADWYDKLSATQALAQSWIVRPLDSNAACFPTTNESAIIGNQLTECCWTPGIGNTPAGYPSWDDYDLSLLQLSRLNVQTCTAGSYPCNDAGYQLTNASSGYTYSTKVTYAELYVR